MNNLFPSRLYNQNTFYGAFLKDLHHAKSLVIIESPFITEKRMQVLLPILKKLQVKNIRIIVNTKPFNEHEQIYREQTICQATKFLNTLSFLKLLMLSVAA